MDVVDRRLAEDHTQFVCGVSKAEGLFKKAFTNAYTKKCKCKRLKVIRR